MLAKKARSGHSVSEDLVAVKVVNRPHVSKVEKEILDRVAEHPFVVQLLEYFETKVSFSFKQSIAVH
jgi:hypothetical protein